MKLSEIVETLELDVKASEDALDREIDSGYASDLLSDVIANAEPGDIWVTLQIHQNIVAVAVMKALGAIVLVSGRQPEAAAIEKAEREVVPLLVSDLPAFEVVGRLYDMGITGTQD